jgi:membrane-bound serine protease (ClpP class)
MNRFQRPCLIILSGVCLVLSFIAHARAEAPKPIHYIKAEGIVNPVMSEFLVKGIREAEASGAEALIIELDTPGGLDASMRDIVKAMLSSEAPIAVYIAPSGSRAASAGVFMTYAANIAAMAPGTNIGSAHPVQMGEQKMDEVMEKKVTNDAVAYIRGIALKRGRNADWAENAVRMSVNITAEDAVRLKVVDIMAGTRDELIEKMHGRRVDVLSGQRALNTRGATVKVIEMGMRFKVLNAITNPNVAYILMMIGLIGLYFELSNPGLILPGVVGAISLVLAFYSFQTLSINYAGLILIGLAAIFFILEVKIVSFGLLAIAGLISLILGSLMLFDSPLPFMRLSVWVIMPAIIIMSVVVLWMMYYAVRVFRTRPVSGMEGLLEKEGVAAEDMPGQTLGRVFIEGEYWNALSDDDIKKGERVRVIKAEGLRLRVQRAEHKR